MKKIQLMAICLFGAFATYAQTLPAGTGEGGGTLDPIRGGAGQLPGGNGGNDGETPGSGGVNPGHGGIHPGGGPIVDPGTGNPGNGGGGQPESLCTGSSAVTPWREPNNDGKINLCDNYTHVGIGTDNPEKPLHVASGGARIDGASDLYGHLDMHNFLLKNGKVRIGYHSYASNGWQRGYLGHSRQWSEGSQRWINVSSHNDFAMIKFENNGGVGIYSGTNSGDITNDDMYDYRRLSITNTGYIRIYNKLTIGDPDMQDYGSSGNHKLLVDGSIVCEELKVEMSYDWPDYVFGSKHNLRSLSELKSYINENNHLPGVPSEAEVKENGVAVSEMLKIQMEKIEELTLYILKQEERIKELEANQK